MIVGPLFVLPWSVRRCEFPQTEEGIMNLIDRIEAMTKKMQPTFVTLTWRSSFQVSDRADFLAVPFCRHPDFVITLYRDARDTK